MDAVVRQIASWQAERRPVTVVRLLAVRGVSGHDSVPLAAFTPGEPAAGRVLSGALDALVAAPVERGQLLELKVDDAAADRCGMSCGGTAQVLVQPADELPQEAWRLIAAREPVCLVTDLDGERAAATRVFTRATIGEIAAGYSNLARLFARGTSEGAVLDGVAATAIWPVPHLVIVGDGLIADALVASAHLLGWSTEVANDAGAADQVGQLASCDGVVVLSHDRAVDGPVLAAALAGDAGYVGALGARHTQSARAEWLAAHGVTDLTRVHGPAGLDLGARTPAEIAVAITAEMLAARSGRAPASLRERSGPVHDDGLNAPPPRYPLSSG
jgi:xanthine dehydrogenase accessory factor